MGYQYRRLNPENRDIRLLEVFPCQEGVPLSCSILHVSLDDVGSIPYETVSYVWGEPDPCSYIMFGEESLYVPRSTEAALRRMALPDRSRTLWIDAVCIDQKDLEERSHQVSMMKDIFASASRGLVFLGDVHSSWALPAFNTVRNLSYEIERDMGGAANVLDAFYGGRNWMRAVTPIQTPFEEEPVRVLFSLSWFSRVWMVQEAASAPRNLCIWASASVDLDLILSAATWLYRYHGDHISDRLFQTPGLYNASEIGIAHTNFKHEHGASFYIFSYLLRRLGASDPRDKVYATFGLLRKAEQDIHGFLVPDYTMSVQEVFQNATRHSILVAENFSLYSLRRLRHRDQEDLQADGFPSWCLRPDGTYHPKIHAHVLPPHPDQYRARSATMKSVDLALVKLQHEPKVLSLRGVEVDTIGALSSVCPSSDHIGVLLAWFDEVHKLWSKTHSATLCTNFVSRLLIGGITRSGDEWSDSESHAYSLLRSRLKDDLGIVGSSDLHSVDTKHQQAARYWYALERACSNRRVAISEIGYALLVPKVTKLDDLVVDLNGGEYPFVLRPTTSGYLFVGQCYIDGGMPWQLEEYEAFVKRMHTNEEKIFDLV